MKLVHLLKDNSYLPSYSKFIINIIVRLCRVWEWKRSYFSGVCGTVLNATKPILLFYANTVVKIIEVPSKSSSHCARRKVRYVTYMFVTENICGIWSNKSLERVGIMRNIAKRYFLLACTCNILHDHSWTILWFPQLLSGSTSNIRLVLWAVPFQILNNHTVIVLSEFSNLGSY